MSSDTDPEFFKGCISTVKITNHGTIILQNYFTLNTNYPVLCNCFSRSYLTAANEAGAIYVQINVHPSGSNMPPV
jgi:hypothetical protein